MNSLIRLFFPAACLGCRTPIDDHQRLCEPCSSLVEHVEPPFCPICCEPGAEGRCNACREWPPPFSRAFAPFLHAGPVVRAIHRFKYEDEPSLAPRLAKWAVSSASAFWQQAPAQV